VVDAENVILPAEMIMVISVDTVPLEVVVVLEVEVNTQTRRVRFPFSWRKYMWAICFPSLVLPERRRRTVWSSAKQFPKVFQPIQGPIRATVKSRSNV